MLRTEIIKNLLNSRALADLATLYNPNMEVQVNVAQDNGEKTVGEFRGKQWQAWTDGIQTWKSFRIPYKAKSEPEYEDKPLNFDLEAHVEAIGMTGWDWKNRLSRWVAFDFDAIIGHADTHGKKMSNEDLKRIRETCEAIPWVTTRKSTSGNGLHLYVFLTPTPTRNHTEHAALARAVLGILSAQTGVDLSAKVDICGGNMWVWHRKGIGNPESLKLLKQGYPLTDIPVNWQDHVRVISGRSTRVIPAVIADSGIEDEFSSLVSRKNRLKLDTIHKSHMTWLSDHNCVGWWDSDNHMLVTHTVHLKEMHEALGLKGCFDTMSRHSSPQNCFCFPIKDGGWVVRRYSLGVSEHPSWEQDGEGWTRCFYNRAPSVPIACRAMGGIEDTNGEFQFRMAEDALRAAALLQANVQLDPKYMGRKAWIKEHKDGRIIFSIDKEDTDQIEASSPMTSWLPKKDYYQKLFGTATAAAETEITSQDEYIRHLVSQTNEDAGWAVNVDSGWNVEPTANVKFVLSARGIRSQEIPETMGNAVVNCWRIVNRPFQSEYPGDRLWNRDAAQLRFQPADPTSLLEYPTWSKILQHCGESLTPYLKSNEWCRNNGINSGGEYLKCWAASVFQYPERRLPYLFFFSPEQNTGKSTYHEALGMLLTKGYVKAANAIKNQQGFNGELQGAIICAVEEEDTSKGAAYNRIKEWITARELCIHPKNKTPFHVTNTTHWIQCANDHNYCPIFPGDTRITVIRVPQLKELIPTTILYERLEAEAPAFLADLLSMELPRCNERLNIPVIETGEKQLVKASNMNDLDVFLSDHCEYCQGSIIKYSDLWDRFQLAMDPISRASWTQQKMGKALPTQFPKGRSIKDNQIYIGNIKYRGAFFEPTGKMWIPSPTSEHLIEIDIP